MACVCCVVCGDVGVDAGLSVVQTRHLHGIGLSTCRAREFEG